MIITEKQLLCLIDILKDSIKGPIEVSGQFTISVKQRVELYSAILNQHQIT